MGLFGNLLIWKSNLSAHHATPHILTIVGDPGQREEVKKAGSKKKSQGERLFDFSSPIFPSFGRSPASTNCTLSSRMVFDFFFSPVKISFTASNIFFRESVTTNQAGIYISSSSC